MSNKKSKSNNISYNNIQGFKNCAGKNCSNKATSPLKVKYINKIGHFCQLCANDLLQLDLVEKINSFDSALGDVL